MFLICICGTENHSDCLFIENVLWFLFSVMLKLPGSLVLAVHNVIVLRMGTVCTCNSDKLLELIE